jgi:diguanylate cyclase (GGDEF)-like protein
MNVVRSLASAARATDPQVAAWQALVQALPDPAWVVALPSLCVVAVNPAALQLLGLTEAALRDTRADHLLATPEDLAYWDEAGAGAPGELLSETLLQSAAGELLRLRRTIRPFTMPGAAAATHCLVTLLDTSEAERAQAAQEDAVAELQATLESTADGILVTDLGGRVRAFNRRFAQLWGMPEDLLAQRHDAAVQDWMRRTVDDPATYDRRLEALRDATLVASTERLTLLSGQVLERVARPLWSRGRPLGRVWSYRDLSERLAADQRIETLARTDDLTGLPNRRCLAEQIEAAVLAMRHDGDAFALLVLDLDRFRLVNDSLGHEVGDRALREVAERLRRIMRQGDGVARIGGDQFALLLQHADAPASEAAAARVLDAVAQPWQFDGVPFSLTCSVGIALAPGHGRTADELLRHAEGAMRQAKLAGSNSLRFHQQHADVDLRQHMRLDHAMRQALASQRFRLHYQPQLELASGRIVGAEALIRWRDPALGEVSPMRFIPVAEDTGFIVAIGDWVLAQAARQAAAWLQAGRPLTVAINVSALQFRQPSFVERVAAVLQEHGLPARWLELELTESILVRDADEALQRLQALDRLGVRLSIDDFGTGYSSLAYLKRFPIGRLKIDRSFIQGLPGDSSDAGIVQAIVQMARALQMQVIAEGVETEPQRAFLQDLGCHQFQGWLFAPAMDALSFERLLPPA